MLNGKLEYEPPNENTLRFNGTLKLKKDPKIENLNIDNFIPKGSKIRQTSWYSPHIFIFNIFKYLYISKKDFRFSSLHWYEYKNDEVI